MKKQQAFPSGSVRKKLANHCDPGGGFIISDYVEPKNAGMDLRDYFAAKAMQALISDPDIRGTGWKEKIAETAYAAADAMMDAREQGAEK